jgi:hypothetical protein
MMESPNCLGQLFTAEADPASNIDDDFFRHFKAVLLCLLGKLYRPARASMLDGDGGDPWRLIRQVKLVP